jgi:hypothetical protein
MHQRSAACLLLALTGLAAILASCGKSQSRTAATGGEGVETTPPGWTRYEDRSWGYSVAYPGDWRLATQRRVPSMGDPVVILSLATFPLRPDDAAYPIPRHGFDADEVFLTIQERGLDPQSDWRTFPPRPANFRYEPGQGSVPADYLRRDWGFPFADHWFNFSDAGRHFHVQVGIGGSAPAEAGEQAYRILDSLRFDAGVKPDWPSAG